jgi:hypothetical protein
MAPYRMHMGRAVHICICLRRRGAGGGICQKNSHHRVGCGGVKVLNDGDHWIFVEGLGSHMCICAQPAHVYDTVPPRIPRVLQD